MTNRNLHVHVESLTLWWEFLKQYYSTELKKKETTWLFDSQNQPGLTFDPLFTCKNCKNFNPSCWINLSRWLPSKGGWHEDSWKTPIRLTETLTLTRQQPLSTFSIWKLKIKTKFTALNCLITLGFNLLVSIQCVCMRRYHLKSSYHVKMNKLFDLTSNLLFNLPFNFPTNRSIQFMPSHIKWQWISDLRLLRYM